MKANKKTLLALIYILENEQEYWDFNEMIGDIIAETELLKHKDLGEHTLSPDECGVEWGGNDICGLDEFIDDFSRRFLEKICNIAKSMIGEEIDCYFEDEE